MYIYGAAQVRYLHVVILKIMRPAAAAYINNNNNDNSIMMLMGCIRARTIQGRPNFLG